MGTISMIACTPDICAPLPASWLVDRSPGVLDRRLYFGFLPAIAALGLAATSLIRARTAG